MKFLSHIRSKSRPKTEQSQAQIYRHDTPDSHLPYPLRVPNPTTKLPDKVFKDIFSAVCPHSRDETYLSSEDSIQDGGCMLCDLRDLSHCAMVNRQWAGPAQDML